MSYKINKKHMSSLQSSSKYRLLNTSSKVLMKTDRPGIDPKLQKHLATFASIMRVAISEFNLRWGNPDLKVEVGFSDFHLLRTLGVGGFGRCMLACKVADPTSFYAVKILDKQNIVKFKQIDHVMQELRVLDAVRFTFLVELLYYFKNNCYLFCALPFIAGGEMFNLLAKEGQFDEEQGKFYAAQVVLAFEYFHSNGVIYRDLKPENILIDGDGYIKVTDYGFCKKVDANRTWTLCGTPEYLAPEVILSQGYSYSVDWWTLGILTFEMIAGHPPFHSSEPMKLYAQIVHGKYNMCDKFSRPLQHLVLNLLQTNRDKRFGVLKNGIRDIKTHEWFRKVDWASILARQVKPPVVPKVPESPLYNDNFDTYREDPLRSNDYEEYPKEFKVIAVKTQASRSRYGPPQK